MLCLQQRHTPTMDANYSNTLWHGKRIPHRGTLQGNKNVIFSKHFKDNHPPIEGNNSVAYKPSHEGKMLIAETTNVCSIEIHWLQGIYIHADSLARGLYLKPPETTKKLSTYLSCHNFFPLSSVQIIIVPACCLLCVL